MRQRPFYCSWFCSVFSLRSPESAGKNAWSWVPLVQTAYGSACVCHWLRCSWRQIPRLLCRCVPLIYSHHSCLSSCFLLKSYSGLSCVSDSSTARHLQSSGVMAVSQQAWSKITVYSKQGFRYDSQLICVFLHLFSLFIFVQYVWAKGSKQE